MDDAMEKDAHVVLTALCSQRLSDTAGMPISLYPIQDHSDPEWTAHMDEACNVFQNHYHAGWAYMARYAREVNSLKQEIGLMAEGHGSLPQQLRALESRIHDKYQELLTFYRRSIERDHKLLRHRSLLREAHELTDS
jgi:hypothetical protein